MARQQPTKSLEDRVAKLRENRVSGAVDLALEALDLANDWLADGRPAADLARQLGQMHPAIATVANVGRLLEEPAGDLPARLAETRSSLVEGNQRIARNLQRLIPAGSRIITLSNSSTVREALFALAPAAVYVMRSLPGGEGETQAREIQNGFRERAPTPPVEVIPDGSVGNIVLLIDCALVGIDTFDHGGAILHKVGTVPLALCCRRFGKPFYASGHSLKLSRRELHGIPDPSLSPGEQLFDCTTADLITAIVTEEAAG